MQAAVAIEMSASEVRERLVEFVGEMAGGLGHVRRCENALIYVRGLIEHGGRKSLAPTLFGLGEDGARYESLQQFLADSPWDWALLVRACAERVVPEIGVEAWVIDDTGIAKDGRHSPGVRRQYSGTLGKVGNGQIAVSVHASGERATQPLDGALYLPGEWCADAERRRRAKIPGEVVFATKPRLAAGLIERAATWAIPRAPVLGEEAYGKHSELRGRLDDAGIEYVLGLNADALVYDRDTVFGVPARRPGWRGPAPSALVADRQPRQLAELAASLEEGAFQTLVYHGGDGRQRASRFAILRAIAAHPVDRDHRAPREQWLIIERPHGRQTPSDYWISNLPADTPPQRLARLARLRWTIELDYRQLKGELGLDHDEGRSYIGLHHHRALVTCAHALLTLERICPKAPRPA